jgi:2-polyprenyl-6-methoxyphenol hydroxylase-like FAD-dependent oxidoreductase
MGSSSLENHSSAIRGHDVVIAGGGPTGLMLAAELKLAGVDVGIIERRKSQELAGARAGGLHARTIEVLDQRGIAGRFLAEGQMVQAVGFASTKLALGSFPTRHPYTLGLWQNHIERILAGWAGELEVPIHRGCEVTGFTQHGTGVEVQLSDGTAVGAQYLVGCDGGRSAVRKAAGIAFPGSNATTSSLIAEVEMTETPDLGIHRTALGTHSFGKLEYEIRDGEIIYKDGGPTRVMVPERRPGATGEPTLDDLRAALTAVCGTDYGVHSPVWISRFTDMARQAAAYRDRRVLLAGDAAHVHSPVGGQGLNLGVQDAVNVGWKLAQVVKRISPDSLLDTYHAERHPVGARVLRNTRAQVALLRTDDHAGALRDVVAELLAFEEPRKRFAAMTSGLDIRYDFGEGHSLLGRRTPDLDVVIANEPTCVFALMHEARPMLINFGRSGVLASTTAPWTDRVRTVDAECRGAWELPVIGTVIAPAAVLMRPDGYVAWVGEGSDAGLVDALTRWFGAPKT